MIFLRDFENLSTFAASGQNNRSQTTKTKSKKMKKIIIMSLMAVFCLATADAQKTVASKSQRKNVIKENKQVTDEVFTVVQQMPAYQGGEAALLDYLKENVKYPKDAAEQEVSGRILVSFIVEKDGTLSDIKVLKTVFPSLDAEAIRVVKAMPKWIPGKQNGVVVRVKYVLPITFRL